MSVHGNLSVQFGSWGMETGYQGQLGNGAQFENALLRAWQERHHVHHGDGQGGYSQNQSVQQLEQKVAGLMQQIQQLEGQNGSQQQIQRLEQKVADLQHRIQQLEAQSGQIQQLEQKIADLQKQIQQLEAQGGQGSGAQQQIQKLEQEVSGLLQQLRRLEGQDNQTYSGHGSGSAQDAYPQLV
jgi:predicted RNase H-like nuclease (RuvC/YqgF family)